MRPVIDSAVDCYCIPPELGGHYQGAALPLEAPGHKRLDAQPILVDTSAAALHRLAVSAWCTCSGEGKAFFDQA